MGGVDFIFANWGLNALIDAISLKSRSEFRDTPLILNLETFPTFWESGARQNFEIWALKRLWKFVDVLILPTPEMGEYLASFIPNYDKTELIMSPFWFTKSYIQNYENQSDESRDSSHPKDLVFIGQCDDGRSLNQVSESLLELAEAGIHVWYNAPMPIEHPNLHLFPYMDGADLYHGKMTAFLREFKACLVLYNHKKSPADRFQTSLPSRFLLPVQARVPVVLPQGKYRAMENFVQQNRCGYAYKNVGELAEILRGETPFSNKSQFANTRIDEFFDRKKSKEMFNRINILS